MRIHPPRALDLREFWDEEQSNIRQSFRRGRSSVLLTKARHRRAPAPLLSVLMAWRENTTGRSLFSLFSPFQVEKRFREQLGLAMFSYSMLIESSRMIDLTHRFLRSELLPPHLQIRLGKTSVPCKICHMRDLTFLDQEPRQLMRIWGTIRRHRS